MRALWGKNLYISVELKTDRYCPLPLGRMRALYVCAGTWIESTSWMSCFLRQCALFQDAPVISHMVTVWSGPWLLVSQRTMVMYPTCDVQLWVPRWAILNGWNQLALRWKLESNDARMESHPHFRWSLNLQDNHLQRFQRGFVPENAFGC